VNPHTNADSPKDDGLGHYCGIAGVWSPEPMDLPDRLFYMLFSLQHRGQEGAGICFENAQTGQLELHKDSGMVSAVLGRFLGGGNMARLGIGHTRYSTAGGSGALNAQPLLVSCSKGTIALAHNGNISNSEALKRELTAQGAIFQSTSDTELILHLMSHSKKSDPQEIILEAFGRLEGAFSIVMLWNGRLYALRDPDGFRPLYLSSSESSVLVGSETCAVQMAGSGPCRQIEPGEVYSVGPEGARSFRLAARKPAKSHCVFELIYFARPDSGVFGRSVHDFRKRLGAALADIDPVRGDVVIPVPDSGNVAALGYAARSGLPFDFGLCRNHYSGRSFIMPTPQRRELAVRMKLHPVRDVVEGKRIIMIDDSLVRGTTSKIIVRLLKEAGAAEVHLRLSSPEIHWPCYYGIDIPTRKELISNRMDPEGIAREIGADSVIFLPEEKLRECLGASNGDYCMACFNGRHPYTHAGGE
jgi:amidophosphoribosyltransferase